MTKACILPRFSKQSQEALAASTADATDEESRYEILGEEAASAGVGGHLVGYRSVTRRGTQTETVEGIFHLIEREGRWKIEELFYTSLNGQALSDPIRLSQSYRELASTGSTGQSIAARTPQPTKEAQTSGLSVPRSLQNPGLLVTLGKFLTAGGLKKVGLALMALLGLGALGAKKKEES